MNKEELEKLMEHIELKMTIKKVDKEPFGYEEIQLIKLCKICSELQQENNQLKEQYCERTDCVGRLGNSKKVERLENTIKELRSWLEVWLKITEKQYDELNELVRKSFLKVTIDTLKEVLSKLNELEGKNERKS